MEKRLNAAELRQQQAELERAKLEAKEKQLADTQASLAQRELEKERTNLQEIRASWYDNVLEVTKKPGGGRLTFLVIAEVLGQASQGVEDLIDELSKDGYKAYFARLFDKGSERNRRSGTVVRTREEQGWLPANIPRFGRDGEARNLVLSWSE